jgi:hypothetical protein
MPRSLVLRRAPQTCNPVASRGQTGLPLEFAIKLAHGNIKVEVKAPFRPMTESFWWGDDFGPLENALVGANKQFKRGDRNLLIFVPQLRISVFTLRTQIERAFIGEDVIRIAIDTRTGWPAGLDHFVFKESRRPGE